ncbi:hypothetical protein FKR81_08630 [Lentzea tibetensis]|uniref:Uncharacterized protein n=1 Tax=Lentzea tibetensis TaxID=2591470 RepID=A0A563EZ31_9PSEU|nr:hypothetical protein [Lentzea tibetensis]TWP52394.1 hypothetical protein FKR81_08630 [Lentzea tibetensis]
MASIDDRSRTNGMDDQRTRLVLSGVFGLLSIANLGMVVTEPTAWQGTFAAALLIVALWLWFNTPGKVTR